MSQANFCAWRPCFESSSRFIDTRAWHHKTPIEQNSLLQQVRKHQEIFATTIRSFVSFTLETPLHVVFPCCLYVSESPFSFLSLFLLPLEPTMQSYTYRRRQVRKGNDLDSYNALLQSPHPIPTEYWTNGVTTILTGPAPALSSPVSTSDFLASSPTKEQLGNDCQFDSSTPSIHRQRTRFMALRLDMSSTKSERPVAASSTSTGTANAATTHHHNDPQYVRNSLLAGSVSGMASTFMLYPLDLVRTKLQASDMAHQGQPGVKRRGPVQMFHHTLRNGGIRALYTGMSLPLAAQAVYKGTVFTVNNVTQQALVNYHTLEHHKTGLAYNGQLTMTDRFLSGFIGGAVNALFFVTPVEFIRNQMIAQHSKFADSNVDNGSRRSFQKTGRVWHVIKYSVRDHGITSLWRGASWSVARDGWGCGWFFLSMAWTQKQLEPLRETYPYIPATMISGGVGGLMFWVSSLPLDTVKTWVQSSELHVSVSPMESIQRILQQEGPLGVVQKLFRGWQVAYGRGIPSAAITLTVYSYAYQYLQHSYYS